MTRTRPAALAAALLALTAGGLTGTTGAAQAATINYVALGDSYSAGGGSSTTYLNSCNRSTNAYPYLFAQANSPATFSFQACGAATTADVLNHQLAPLTSSTTLASMTIGGNDIGLREVLSSCLLGSDADCHGAVASAANTARTELPGRLDTVYGSIRSRAVNAHVVILGYPRFYDLGSSFCPGISPTRRAALNALNWPVGQSFHPTAAGQSGAYLSALEASD
ncbi:SGNH/GDSL hydrolase family protein [Kitasatospora sp. NPDC101801]|uniref:SGNH/GDSL hydrolase family protein n=1 Tax=Kitasatospora sp. NPDC101801 TaxID=3364103 RepID=UPI00382C1E21